MKKNLMFLVIVVALVVGMFFLYMQNSGLKEDIGLLRHEHEELIVLRAAQEETQKLRTQIRDVERAKQEHAELMKLRSEVGRSRAEKQKLAEQLQQLQQTVASISGNGQQLSSMQELQRENAQLKSEQQEQQIIQGRNSCLNNLRQLDGAIQQWALEYRHTADDTFTTNDIAPYLKQFPVCSGGGTYMFGRVRDDARCSIHGDLSQLTNQK